MKTRKFKRIMGAATAASILSACMVGTNLTVNAETTSTYTLTIPSTLNVANSGWNSIGNISATGSLESGKKLTVTAASTNDWKLVSGTNNVSYTMKSASADTVATTSWEFSELSSTATTKPIGIDVEDYSAKPAGTYQDTVTFTASVENMVQAGSISYATTSVNKKTTDSTFTNTLTKTGDGSVTYSIAGDNVATINASTGEVTLSGNAGTATITATVTDSENYTYATKTATYTLTVKKTTTLADAFKSGAVVRVTAAKSNNTLTYTVQGTYNGSSFGSVTQSNSMNMDAINKGASLTKSGDNLVAEIKTNAGNITFTFDTTNNTYTLTTNGTGMQNAPTILNSITVNGNALTVTKSN